MGSNFNVGSKNLTVFSVSAPGEYKTRFLRNCLVFCIDDWFHGHEHLPLHDFCP